MNLAKISAVLHLKYPALYPVLDGHLQQVYRLAARRTARVHHHRRAAELRGVLQQRPQRTWTGGLGTGPAERCSWRLHPGVHVEVVAATTVRPGGPAGTATCAAMSISTTPRSPPPRPGDPGKTG